MSTQRPCPRVDEEMPQGLARARCSAANRCRALHCAPPTRANSRIRAKHRRAAASARNSARRRRAGGRRFGARGRTSTSSRPAPCTRTSRRWTTTLTHSRRASGSARPSRSSSTRRRRAGGRCFGARGRSSTSSRSAVHARFDALDHGDVDTLAQSERLAAAAHGVGLDARAGRDGRTRCGGGANASLPYGDAHAPRRRAAGSTRMASASRPRATIVFKENGVDDDDALEW